MIQFLSGVEVENVRTPGGSLDNDLEMIKSDIKVNKNGIKNLEGSVKGLASGSPLVANSIAEMTDKTRVYVNTTDGHWYYYNGGSWADGGVYQAVEVEDNSIGYTKFDKTLFNKNYYVTSNGKDTSNVLGLLMLIDVKDFEIKDTYTVNASCVLDIKFNYNYACNFKARFIGNSLSEGDIIENNPIISNTFNVTRNTNNYSPVMLLYVYITSNNATSTEKLSYYLKNLSLQIDAIDVTSKILDVKLINTSGTIIDTQMSNNTNLDNILINNANIQNVNEKNNAIKYEGLLYNSSGIWQNDSRFDTLIIPVKPNKNYYFRQSSHVYSILTTGALGIITNSNGIKNIDMNTLTSKFGGKIIENSGFYLIKSFRKEYFLNNNYEEDLIIKQYKTYNENSINSLENIDFVPYFEKSILNNKEILVIGDSISDNTLLQYSNIYYYDLLSKNDACNVIPDGKGGTGYTMGSGSYLNFTNRMDNYPDTYKPDYIIYFGGANDWFNAETNQIPLGTVNDKAGSHTFVGYLKYTLEKTIRLYTYSKILVATPIRRNRGVEYNGKIVNSIAEGYRNTLDDYCEMIIKIANSYGIATLDLYNQSGLNPRNTYNKSYYFTKPDTTIDDTHPNFRGQEKLYPCFKEKLKSI